MSIFIIAEIGINHNGDLNIAKDLIKLSKEIGVDAVKFQKRTIENVYSKELLDSARKSPWGETQRAQKEGLEFSYDEYLEIDNLCKELKIEWFASAWDLESQDFLAKFNLKFNKIASAMIVFDELLKKVASEKKHTFISTGMSKIEEIENAVNIFRENDCPFEIMHCVSTYPLTNLKDANLNVIHSLKNKFNCNVGYSGHENGIGISIAASALNISSLERHITLDRTMYGSDQSASLEPEGFRQLVRTVRKVEIAMGGWSKKNCRRRSRHCKKIESTY